MSALLSDDLFVRQADPETALKDVAKGFAEGALAAYLGPGVMALADGPLPPDGPAALADFLGSKVALPKRARGNLWAAAQYIESQRHRNTVTALLSEAFAQAAPPTPLHDWLAASAPPLIVDTWYDDAMRTALAAASASWGEVQGITRAAIGEDQWYRFYDSTGAACAAGAASAWKTLLYKPHGGIGPAKNFLVSDADYVEVLTEIDIQTPIPDEVIKRRLGLGFVYFGCHFQDQMLRTYARQISKRSSGPHYAIVEPDMLSRNEMRFLAAQGVVVIPIGLAEAVEALRGFSS